MKSKEVYWHSWLTENGNYKFVSLLIALILWVTVLGRRDFGFSRNFDLEIKTAPGVTVVAQTAEKVKVRVVGPRNTIKKFVEDAGTNRITVDLGDRVPGVYEIEVSSGQVRLPPGLRVVSIKPNLVRIELIEKSE